MLGTILSWADWVDLALSSACGFNLNLNLDLDSGSWCNSGLESIPNTNLNPNPDPSIYPTPNYKHQLWSQCNSYLDFDLHLTPAPYKPQP